MKTLYISDLDGTLLNERAELSGYTIEKLNAFIHDGGHFTIATARTAATVSKILAPLDVKIPVILMNGVLIYDIPTKKYLSVHYISTESFTVITQVLKANSVTGFMFEVKNNQLSTYYERMDSKAMQEFHDERVNKYRKTFVQVPDFSEVDYEHIIYFALLGTKERLEPIYQMLQSYPDISMAFYPDVYSEEGIYYLEMFSSKATKYNAAMYLKELYQYDYMIGFGDNLNDLPLFNACDETCAVANAKDAVKAAADHIIKSNLENGVADWLGNKSSI